MKTGDIKLVLFISVLLLISILAIGTTGYIVFEDMSFMDALYMTVITMSTVGYKEVHELSNQGRIFTMFLIVTSFGVFLYSLTKITAHLIEGRLSIFFSSDRVTGRIKKMKNHVIVVGYGRNGQQTVNDLLQIKREVVVVEKNREIINARPDKKPLFMEGDATEDEVLLKAGIKTASALITTLPVDADNLFVVLTARSLNPALRIISRASHEASEDKLHKAGASHVVMPEKVGGTFMVNLVAKPDLAEFFHHLSIEGSEGVNLVEVDCSDLPAEYRERTIHDMSIRRLTGANIVGFKTPDGQYIINPGGDTVMNRGAKLFVLGTPEQIVKVKQILLETKSI